MASVQCKNCKTGIHYHGEPEGIEYIFISEKDWNIITKSSFDKDKKQFSENSSMPMLFRSDTIEDDFKNSILKIWKCPECGSLIFFDGEGTVNNIFTKTTTSKKSTTEGIKQGDSRFVIFDDYTWDIITEKKIPDNLIPEMYSPTGYAQVFEDDIILFDKDHVKKQEYTKSDFSED